MHLAGVKLNLGWELMQTRSRLNRSLMWILERGNSALLAVEGPRLSDEALGKPGGHEVA